MSGLNLLLYAPQTPFWRCPLTPCTLSFSAHCTHIGGAQSISSATWVWHQESSATPPPCNHLHLCGAVASPELLISGLQAASPLLSIEPILVRSRLKGWAIPCHLDYPQHPNPFCLLFFLIFIWSSMLHLDLSACICCCDSKTFDSPWMLLPHPAESSMPTPYWVILGGSTAAFKIPYCWGSQMQANKWPWPWHIAYWHHP